jgi:hypothetical protein
LLAGLDHRCGWARRLRDLINDHVADLGGQDTLSHAEQLLVRRASMLALQCELLEQKFSEHEDGAANTQEIETYQRCTNTLRRTLEALGLERRAKTIVPTLSQYLEAKKVVPVA